MRMALKIIALLFMLSLMSTVLFVIPVAAPPPYYHEEGNVNYSGSYFGPVYNALSMGVDSYITIVDLALYTRAFGTESWEPWGVGWGLYNPDGDINGDERVDMRDIIICSQHWGLNYHYSQFTTVSGTLQVEVEVPHKPVQVGDQFTVDIKIMQVTGLNTYEFTLSWNPNLVGLISVVGGGFISGEGEDVLPIIGAFYLYVGDTLTTEPLTQSGSGIFAKITFECLGTGKATLDLSSRLFDIDLNSMPHKDFDGTVKQR
jgi:hypothetical protein